MFILALASVELTSSYRFYQVNAYKIALAMLLISALLPLALWAGLRRALPAPSWGLLALWTLPLLVTLPGIWVSEGRWSYGAPEHITKSLVVIAWAWLAWSLSRLGYGMQLLAALFYMGAACAILALVETARFGHLTPGVFRARASFGNPGYLAGFLLLILPLGIARLFNRPSRTQALPDGIDITKWLHWALDAALTVTVVVALMVNKTRVAQLLTLMLLGSMLLWMSIRLLKRIPALDNVKHHRVLLYFTATLITLAIGGLILSQMDIWARFQHLAQNREWQGRLVPWRAAINAFMNSPWLGHGPGSYYSLFFNFVDSESRAFWVERSYFDPHNLLLDIAVEGGVLGLLAGVGVWLTWLGWLWQHRRNTSLLPAQVYQVHAVIIGVLLMLAFSLTAVSYQMMTLMLPAQVLLAVTIGMIRPSLSASRWRWMAFALFVTTAWLIGHNGLYSKQRFVAISSLPHAQRYAPLQALCDQAPNIYALERLLQLSLSRSDWSRFFNTARQMEQTIPNYRSTRHVIAQAYLRRGDLRNARKAALDYQQRDRYFADNNKLLIRLALLANDSALLMAQLENAIRFSLHKQGFLSSRETKAQLLAGDAPDILVSNESASTVNVTMPANAIQVLLEGLKLHYGPGFPNHKLETGNKFRFLFAPVNAHVQTATGKDRFVEDMLLQLI